MRFIKLFEEFSTATDIIVCVDIQEEYAYDLPFDISEWVSYLEEAMNNGKQIILLYNGEELGFGDESSYINWLFENCEMSEELLDYVTFTPKVYNFFRNPMDESHDHNQIVKVGKYMYEHDINDGRDLSAEDWDALNVPELREYMEGNEDTMFIPDVIEDLKNLHGNIELCGGGQDECLKEVELLFQILNKPYHLNHDYIY